MGQDSGPCCEEAVNALARATASSPMPPLERADLAPADHALQPLSYRTLYLRVDAGYIQALFLYLQEYLSTAGC